MSDFIVKDACGFRLAYGRYTHTVSGERLVRRAKDSDAEWIDLQLKFLARFPGRKVMTSFDVDGECLGTTEEVIVTIQSKEKGDTDGH